MRLIAMISEAVSGHIALGVEDGIGRLHFGEEIKTRGGKDGTINIGAR